MQALDIVILTILAIGSLQSFGLALPLVSKRDTYLALWVTLFAIEISCKIAIQLNIAQPIAQWFGFWLSFDLLYGPLLLLWVSQIIQPSQSRWQLLHLLPAALVGLVTLWHVITLGPGGRSAWINTVLTQGQWQPIVPWLTTLQNFTMYHPLIYTLLTLAALLTYRHRFNQNRSDSLSVRLDWLLSMVGLQVIMWPVAIYFIAYLPLPTATGWLASYIPAVIWINALAAISLYHHSLVIDNQPTTPSRTRQSDTTIVDPMIDRQIANKLNHFVANEQYRQAKLTLDELSDMLAIPSYLLSQHINKKLGTNFFDYINSLRIEAVKQSLIDPCNEQTILDIAFAAGFNSKSTFNTVFKKQVGCTPSQFRAQHSPKGGL